MDSKLKVKSLISATVFILVSCSSPSVNTNGPLIPSVSEPSPVSNSTSSQTYNVTDYMFEVQTSSPYIGDIAKVQVKNLKKEVAKIPFYIQKMPPEISPEIAGPGGNKQPAVPFDETALLGVFDSDLEVSVFSFNLDKEYLSRKGDNLVIEPGETYLIYWEPSPRTLSYVGSINACSV